jgi:hypothetical protein
VSIRVLIIAAIAAAASGCTAELRVGCGPREIHTPYARQTEGACEIVVTQRFGKHGYCSFGHASEPQDGRGGDPSEADVSVTGGFCGAIFGGKRE